MWIVNVQPVLGQTTDQMLDLLVNLVQLTEDLLGKLLDGFPSFGHARSEGGEFNKLCGETVR